MQEETFISSRQRKFSKEKLLPLGSTWDCITTVWLAAIAEGLGMSPAYFALHGQGYLKEILGIPDTVPEAKPRKSLNECLHYNHFGIGHRP